MFILAHMNLHINLGTCLIPIIATVRAIHCLIPVLIAIELGNLFDSYSHLHS